ncbi:unnamed protein product [Polarella glacialis]|uniref:Uncharacterized protein n=1 Tax=Polarella glacialis TaxID=89957 RepID=A0A813GAN0_POLGL|nr:unnamed protein product [Polarella glacialis]
MDPMRSPLLKDALRKKGTIFSPGHRIRMNIVPIVLNIFIPWVVFIYCFGLTSFQLMYTSPMMAWLGVSLVFFLWLAIVLAAYCSRRFDPDPSWFTVTSLMVLACAIIGIVAGLDNFWTFEFGYYTIKDMKVAKKLDPSVSAGEDVMDAGIFEFTAGTQLDAEKTWHFKKGSIYCVAPIISNTSRIPLRQTYDFWAVGKDCCSQGASDFRCGSWGSASAHKGIRSLDTKDLKYYHLAVQQAASLYDIMAPHPLFLDWSMDPDLEIASWAQQSFKNYAVTASTVFVLCTFVVATASARFSFLGRARSAYDTEIMNDPSWKEGQFYSEGARSPAGMYTA